MLGDSGLPGQLEDFVEQVVPLLRKRGLFRHEYAGTTLRDHLGLRGARATVTECRHDQQPNRLCCRHSPCRRCRTATSGCGGTPTTRPSTTPICGTGWSSPSCSTQAGSTLLFIADAVGQLDVYGGDADAALTRGVQTPVTDPLLAVSAMAAATERLGFGVTVSTTYESPYLLARKFSTLDHLTGGRIGWNIVTSLLDSAARNIIGRDRQIPHDERYAMAQEFLEVTYKLWEGSWEPDAVVRDRAGGVYTDATKVHDINHEGEYFSVPGAHLVEPSPQRTPVLFQAGTSPAGREFAARNAELVFASDPRPDVLRANIDDVRRRAVAHGRRPDSIKFLTSVEVVTDSTDSAARAKADELAKYHDLEGGLVLLSALSGVDWSPVRGGSSRSNSSTPMPADPSSRRSTTPMPGTG